MGVSSLYQKADMNLLKLNPVGKARKPRFECHLKIYDLNNIPLVSGSSFIKWHLSHSMHAEHRGRTEKCPIVNHRVDYSYSTLVPSIRITIDRNNNLSECPLELEVIQEFGATEKIVLGVVRLNLSEYIEESETLGKDVSSPPRKRSSSMGNSPPTTANNVSTPPRVASRDGDSVQEGIMRRYLMQDSKVNSTLRVGILIVQIDGDRNYVAPALRTAPVFGGIASLVGEQAEDDVGPAPSIYKSRDASELQDLYRRTLAASWHRQPNELPADECIEDIFSSGDGWKTKSNGMETDSDEDLDLSGSEQPTQHRHHHRRRHQTRHIRYGSDTLRPKDAHRASASASHRHRHRHRRSPSASSDKSISTVTVTGPPRSASSRKGLNPVDDLSHSRSMASMTSAIASDREGGFKRMSEVDEAELREDLVAWKLPGELQVS